MMDIDLGAPRPTTLDLTGSPVTRASCYQRFTDPTLPHQMRIHWDRNRGKNMCQYVAATCNCGIQLSSERPETPGSLDIAKAAYAAHVRSLL